MTTTHDPAAAAALPGADEDLVRAAVDLAHRWMAATAADETPAERRATGRLAALVADPVGLELAVRFVDRVARPQDVRVAAAELADLGDRAADARGFLGPVDQAQLGVGARLAPLLPGAVVPAARVRLRQLVGHLVADAGPGSARTSPAPAGRGSGSTSTCSARPCSARRRRAAGCAA